MHERKKKLEQELEGLERVLEKKSEELNRMQARDEVEYGRRNSTASFDAVKDDAAVGCRRENTNAAEVTRAWENNPFHLCVCSVRISCAEGFRCIIQFYAVAVATSSPQEVYNLLSSTLPQANH